MAMNRPSHTRERPIVSFQGSGRICRYAVFGRVYTAGGGWDDPTKLLFHIDATERTPFEAVVDLAHRLAHRRGSPTYGDEAVESVTPAARDLNAKVELR